MTEESYRKIIEAKRYDLLYITLINQSGYAGVDKKGKGIVDRRIIKDAIPVQENKLLNIPKPKEI